jgi:hypothetical protein
MMPKCIFNYRVLVDVNDGKTIGEYDKQVALGLLSAAIAPERRKSAKA